MGSEQEVVDFISSPRKPHAKQAGPFPQCEAGDGQTGPSGDLLPQLYTQRLR